MQPRSLFSLAEQLERLNKIGDPLGVLAGRWIMNASGRFLPVGWVTAKAPRGPVFGPVAMFKVLVVQAQYNLSDARMQFCRVRRDR